MTTTFAHVVDGKVRVVGLPSTGTLSDGSSVSGFEFLSPDVLSAEGWLPVVEVRSELATGERWGDPVFSVEEGVVVATFSAEPEPPPEPDPMADTGDLPVDLLLDATDPRDTSRIRRSEP